MVAQITDSDPEIIHWSNVPMRCEISEQEYYDVLLEDLSKRGPNGRAKRIRVFHSLDGGKTSTEISLKLTWRGWWEHVYNYVGGDMWPPCGEDVRNSSIKNGRLTFRFATVFQPNRDGTVTSWEAEYWPEIQRWKVHFFEYF